MNNVYTKIGKSMVISAGMGILMFFLRALNIALAWLGAKFITWIFGGYIVSGLNHLFDTTRFTVSTLPVVLVVLSLLGSYLVTTTTVSKD